MLRLINMPRLVIAAPQGQSGKTTVTLGLIGALLAQGYKVQPFKKGPDFIDPSWLSAVARRTCRNLDCFFMDDPTLIEAFLTAAEDVHLAVIEGAMGLYDGIDLEGSGSTAQIAKKLKAPVIMVLDCHRMTRSAAAMVWGFKHFDPKVNVAGVILNNVARKRHQAMLTGAIEEYCGIPVLGCLPKNSGLAIPNRHLGLVPAGENEQLQAVLDNVVGLAWENINLKAILELACQAPALEIYGSRAGDTLPADRPVNIGVIKDLSFTFYYPENLEWLEGAGAKLVQINSLEDQTLPEVDGLFIGGGFPEIFASRLADNKFLRLSIAEKIEQGLPVYAECGGLMYLGRSIVKETQRYPMVGVLPFDVTVQTKPQGHGYTLMQVINHNPFFSSQTIVKGHEFHNSRLVNLDRNQIAFAFRVQKGYGIDGACDGILYKNVLASYNHIHALGVKEWAAKFIVAANHYQQSKKQALLSSKAI